MVFTMNKTVVASGITLALGMSVANAALVTNLGANQSIDSGNFTMLNPLGNTVGGTNKVLMAWDGTGFNASSDYTGPGSTSNITANSTTAFFGYTWTAHDVQIFVPGTYSFDTSLGGGNPESGILNVTVPGGRLGMHMLFDWNGNNNIDVFVVLAQNDVYGAGIGRSTTLTTSGGNQCDGTGTPSIINCLYDGKDFGSSGKPAGDKVWLLATIDGNADGIMGIQMAAGGPFAGFNASFNMDFTSNIPPVANSFGVGVIANTPKVIDLAANASDTPPGTVNPSSAAIVSGPSNGMVVNHNDGTVTYTPDLNFSSPPTDSFKYTVDDNDGATSNVGTVTLTVTASANTPPVANDKTITTDEDTATNIPVTAVATDADGDALTYANFDAVTTKGGSVTVDAGNTVLTYTPQADFNGTDTFTYSVTDGVDNSGTATITMVVNAINDAPVCKDVTLNTDINAELSINVANNLLATCTDVEGDPITLQSTTQPTQPGSMLTFDGSNTLTYTPATDFSGQDSFTYTATDGADTDTRTTFVNVGKIFGNFTMLDSDGVTFGGTNDIVFNWDGTCYNSVADANAGPVNMTMGSDSNYKFFGYPWNAHDIKVFCPGGPYVFDTCNDASVPPSKCGPLSMTVPPENLGGHILFDWNTTSDIDVAIVWNNSTGGTWQNIVPTGQLYQGPAGPTPALDQFYDWISVDADGDGIPGIAFVDGPFIGFRANFNFKTSQSGGGGPVEVPKSSVPNPDLGSASGCTIEDTSVQRAANSDWLLVAGFITWLGLGSSLRSRRKKRPQK